MYEFTHKGLWFRWDALDAVSKRWAAVSLGASMLAAIPIALSFDRAGKALGFALATGRPVAWPGIALPSWAALWIIVCGLVSAVTWWRFSRLQDEMFNRVQNWALGMAGAWTAAALTLWSLLDLDGVVPPIHPLGVIGLFYVLTMGFWMIAVRRWA